MFKKLVCTLDLVNANEKTVELSETVLVITTVEV